ncbi:MAG: hypothetical protein JOZ78_13625 [Chroococcidiopsidaceae cyanobacterium CP_BM_ER_R8_30]|nr:hypothetical protein [Chroococcidiopsidaceae cyanobacterium CP_BM_ER_R8_30]
MRYHKSCHFLRLSAGKLLTLNVLLLKKLGRYEDGWHFLGVLGEPTPEELQFIKQLIERYGSWLATDV